MRLKAALAALTLICAAPCVAAADPSPTAFEAEIGEAKGAMVGEPDKALVHATAAAKFADKLTDPRERALALLQAQWLEGEALNRLNRFNESQPIIARSLTAVKRLAPGSKLDGDLLAASAAAHAVEGKLPLALSEYQAAYDIFVKLGDGRSQAKVLQYIGSIYFDARDYERVLKYYAQSAEVYKGDDGVTISGQNNIGDTLKEMHRFKEAEAHYRLALASARKIDSQVLEVRILNNIASVLYFAGDYAAADATADRGLARAQGLDSGDAPFLWGVKAQVALARHDYAAAKADLQRTFAGTTVTTTTIPYREFHETAYKLYLALGDDRAALTHLTAFKRLDDQAREVAASTNAALMGARFDFANQELRITKLKADQLRRDIANERKQGQLRATLLYGALAAALVIVAGTLAAFFSIRRSRNEVRDANTTLSEVNVELNKALNAKTRFLATTSHEIRTPLNGILGMTQVMLHDSALPPEQRDRVKIVHDAGTTMKALVDDILDVAKIETGKLTVEQVEVELHPLLSGVARLWADEAAAKGLAFAVELQDCPAKMVGDPRRLRQIVFNLMSNAVKFTERGSIRVTAAADGDDLVIRVADSGIGIPAEQLDAIFESFHQVDGDLTRKHGGTGLGLAICRDLAQALGGEISVDSVVGEGSAFTVRLPLGCPAEAPAPAAIGWPASLAEATVLVVEANALTRSVMTAALAKVAGKVLDASPADAVETAAGARVHHVVADLAALGDAAAVTALIASQNGARAVVTLLSASPPEGDATAEWQDAGAAQILKRPLGVPQLVAALIHAHCLGEEQAVAA